VQGGFPPASAEIKQTNLTEDSAMEHAIHSLENEPNNTVEIVVHVTEELQEQGRCDLVSALESEEDIVTAEFCPSHFHLMLVRYDRDLYSSQDVLDRVTSQNVSARLIGPV
jgi:hypothetical protein